jgi:cytochrome b involved in lipid metabolism
VDELGIFDLITGLPVHVFVTHAVVVLLPLAVITLILVVAFPRLRQNYRYPAVGLAIIGALSAIVAEQSGEALEARVGVAEKHSEWGEMLPPVAVALAVLSVIWLIVSRMSSSPGKILAAVIGGIVIIVGIVAVVITVLAGHSGAESVWGDQVSEGDTAVVEPADEAAMPEAPAEEMQAEEEPAVSADASVLSLETVALNDSEDSCWAVINGNVYDLTDWISSHPGGASRIIGLCGIDGTSQFEGQHGGSAVAESALAGYLLGPIGDPAP